MPRRRRVRRALPIVVLLAAAVGLAGTPLGDGARVPPPPPTPLPVSLDDHFVTALSAPVVAPGAGGQVAWTVADALSAGITNVTIALEFYEFNGYPGNATGPLPVGPGAPTFTATGGPAFSTDLGSISNGSTSSGAASFSTGAGAPQGTYAVRVALNFSGLNATYTLESRGFFSAVTWAAATTGPNGTSTLNLTTLGVSGVVPETAVLVRSNPYTVPVYGLLAVALVLAAAGAFYAFRRGPGSSSGARGPDPPQSAPSALGKSATKDGERIRS